MRRNPGAAVESWFHERIERERQHRDMDSGLDWRAWARVRLAAHWYGLLVVLIDIGGVATILGSLRGIGAGAYGLAVMFLVVAVYVEIEVYNRFWPSAEAMIAKEARRPVKALKGRVERAEDRLPAETSETSEEPPRSGTREATNGPAPETHE